MPSKILFDIDKSSVVIPPLSLGLGRLWGGEHSYAGRGAGQFFFALSDIMRRADHFKRVIQKLIF